MNSVVKIAIVALSLLAVAACSPNDPYLRTKTGAAIGAVAGGVLGHQLDHGSGKYVGAAVGAAVGGGIGYAMDQQANQLQQLAAENQRLGVEVQRLQDGSIKVNLPNGVLFDFDNAAIKPEFQPTLNRIAGILNQDQRSTVTVIGYTDSTGPADYNMKLSRRRAHSVADYLAAHGVAPQRLQAEGRGESNPRASNASAHGRQLNRRVELYIRPPHTG